jgi:uncharacterized C2H2 Zn-finger protein
MGFILGFLTGLLSAIGILGFLVYWLCSRLNIFTRAGAKTLRCPACGKRLQSPSELVGKTVKCPGCGKEWRIPRWDLPLDFRRFYWESRN